jgi:guanosine-3',5'-bis(diphosphate) 3'-pyrophosphohydrolase
MNTQSSLDILAAASFAARKHSTQRRKDMAGTPYINHPLEVAFILAEYGGIDDTAILQAALLHDTLEDTDTIPDEIEERFGRDVLDLVLEVTDDKSLPKQLRKQQQIDHAPGLSHGARLIKLGDKISNIGDIARFPPLEWSLARQLAYVEWAENVIGCIRGANAALEERFARVCDEARQRIQESNHPAGG